MYSLVTRYTYTFVEKILVAHNVHEMLFMFRFFVLTKSSMPCVIHITWMPTEFMI